MPTTHVIQKGETISQIASRNGFQNWHLVWDASENATLRNLRGKPESIRPGDKLAIPDPSPRRLAVARGAPNRYQLSSLAPLPVFEFGLFDQNNPSVPLTGFRVDLRLPGDGLIHSFDVPSEGIIHIEGQLVASGEVQLFNVIDSSGTPVLSYQDRCGGMFPIGQSHVVEFPDKRKVADAIASERGLTRRAGWGARTPHANLEPDWDYTAVVIHHSGDSGYKTAKELQDVQMDKEGFDDIAYEYVVQLDGKLFEGRHLAFKSAANSHLNTGRIAIIVAGDFEHQWWDVDDDVTTSALDTVVLLVNTLKKHFKLNKLVGHRDLVPGHTECPGAELYKRLDELRTRTGLTGP